MVDLTSFDVGDGGAVPGSRLGPGPHFTPLDATLQLAEPLPHAMQLGLPFRGRASLGRLLPRAEQSQLEDADAAADVGDIVAANRSGGTAGVECARGVADRAGYDPVDRLNLSIARRF